MTAKVLFSMVTALVVTAVPSPAARRGLPEQVIPECFGVNIHFRGDNDKEVKQIADAGFRFVRMDFSWDSIEKEKGKYDLSEYDGLMTALDRHGIRPLFILDYGNRLYDQNMAPYTDEGRKAFAAYAKAAAAHFKDRGILWEIWNEPNGAQFWHPKPNPRDYALLANLAAKAIHQADPDSTVLGPALAGTEMSYLEEAFKGGVLENIDVVSVHPYRGTAPETAAVDYKAIRALIDRYAPKGKNIPVVSGEWGFSAANMSVEQQSQFLVRQFMTNMLSGVKLSIWYDWHNDGQDPKENEHNFGTVYWDFSPKPAYIAVQALTRELSGCRLVRRLYAANADDYVVLFKKDGAYKLAAWTTDEPHEIAVPLDSAEVKTTDIYGKRGVAKVVGDSLKLKLSQAITYIEVPTGSKRLAIEEGLELKPETPKKPNTAKCAALVRFTNPLDAPVKLLSCGLLGPSGSLMAIGGSSREIGPGKTFQATLVYDTAWNGKSSLAATLQLNIEGMEEPILRTVDFDTSRRFTVTAAPPADNAVTLSFKNPSGEPFVGAVSLTSGPGMTVGALGVPFKLEKGQTFAQLRYPVILADRKQYTFRYSIYDEANETVYASEERTYKLVDAFESPDKWNMAMEGDAEISGSVDLSSVAPPAKLAGVSSCMKLDYKFGNGWKYACLQPKEDMLIQGKPVEVGAWVYGDKSTNFVRCRLFDSTNQCFQPDIATVDWEGWRFVSTPIMAPRTGWWGGAKDGVIHWPLKWETVFLFDSNGGKEQSGTVYAGPMWLIY